MDVSADLDHRPAPWVDWYEFARAALELPHSEAVLYANLRFVEDENRGRLAA